ncbi:MAG: bifunctional 4-hydroxy-2-oxoglutarate aldolase/2-dehydro-3-deoxy-phosphogluconate aldolase [Pirellulales bacterium]|nr:bifunctional 4-hydroxy-2-oxoglutarate aldolase/2-dehydro-3-deoxy-phosphogluconate aldolase [Pirellulales bacterium]
MNDLFQRIGELKLIPLATFDQAEHALPLADALLAGGLPVAEVTFRTDAAEEAIRRIANRGDLLVGAGTVLTTDQADRAIDAGAAFLVAPGTNPKVVAHSLKRGVPIIPGVATPTDIELGMSFGLEVLKIFPIEVLGGIRMLKAISGPYPQIRFIPTGGISAENMLDYLELPQVLACGGSWLVGRDKMANNEFDAIQKSIAKAVALLAPEPAGG